LPDVTLRRGVSALLASLYGLLLVVRYPFRSVLQMLGIALAIVIIASLGAALLFPEWGVMGPPLSGAWQGVLFHKIPLGRTSILALLVFWILGQDKRGLKRALWFVLELAALVTLVGSRSATAILIVLVLVGSWLLLRGMALLPRLLRPALLSLGCFSRAFHLARLSGRLSGPVGERFDSDRACPPLEPFDPSGVGEASVGIWLWGFLGHGAFVVDNDAPSLDS